MKIKNLFKSLKTYFQRKPCIGMFKTRQADESYGRWLKLMSEMANDNRN